MVAEISEIRLIVVPICLIASTDSWVATCIPAIWVLISLVAGSMFGIWRGYDPALYAPATFVEVHQGAVRGLNTLLPFWPGEDLKKWKLDEPPPYIPEPPKGRNSRAHVVLELARRDKLTVRQLYEYLAGARGHWVVVGTPQSIADQMQQWFENGAADGFNVMPPVLPESLNDFVDLVIPELQRRGLFRTRYEGNTLRENLGLERPPNQFSGKRREAA